mgnify:FL=1
MGLDIGTTGCNSALFTADGELVSISYREYERAFYRPKPMYSEMDTKAIWADIAASIKLCLESGRVDPREISGLAVSSFGETVVPIDWDGKQAHPAIDWSDTRSESYKSQTKFLNREIGASTIFEITGYPLNHMPSIIKIL